MPEQVGSSAAPPKVPLLRLDLALAIRTLVEYHGERPWSVDDYATAGHVLALTVEARRGA